MNLPEEEEQPQPQQPEQVQEQQQGQEQRGREEAKQQQQRQELQQEQQSQPPRRQVTWCRLHAMGPRHLLQQHMALGLLASLSTTQWALQYEADAAVCGALPLLSVPSFSQPQPYPLLLMQPAPAAFGGGVMLQLWLDQSEVGAMEQAVAAQGGF
jgi:hypothetical protein